MVNDSLDPTDAEAIIGRLQAQATARQMRLNLHATKKLMQEVFTAEEVVAVLASSVLLENYTHFHKGPCCPILGQTPSGRAMHIACSTTEPAVTIITIYEPTPPKWITPTRRGRQE
jgi:hypothetical protein